MVSCIVIAIARYEAGNNQEKEHWIASSSSLRSESSQWRCVSPSLRACEAIQKIQNTNALQNLSSAGTKQSGKHSISCRRGNSRIDGVNCSPNLTITGFRTLLGFSLRQHTGCKPARAGISFIFINENTLNLFIADISKVNNEERWKTKQCFFLQIHVAICKLRHELFFLSLFSPQTVNPFLNFEL